MSIKSGAALLAAPAESVLLKSPEILVHTCHEREMAVSHWLLAVAQYMREARKEWAVAGIALLRCGGNFSAIRVRAEVVHAAAGAEDLHQVDAYPSDALLGGPVFVDVTSRRYSSSYQRVPCDKLCGNPGSCRMRSVSGPAGLLGVPTPNATDPYAARSYWCVPMDSPGELPAVTDGTHGGVRSSVPPFRSTERWHRTATGPRSATWALPVMTCERVRRPGVGTAA